MQVTVSISSYNQAEFLPEAIESALAQNHGCEVVCVDDGSTDNSLEIARKYEPKLKVVSQVNKGLPSARNTGIMHAKGDWILFLDADDILLPDAVSEIEYYAETTDADIIGLSFQEFGISNNVVILQDKITIEKMRLGNHLPYFSAVKRDALLECGGYSPRMTWGAEDMHIWFDLLTRGKKVVTIPMILVLYRTKASSMWSETKKHQAEYMAQIQKDFPQAFTIV